MSSQIKPIPLSFFITPPHPCPYLTDELSQTVFLSPEINSNSKIYSALIEKGFRRSGEHIYRPKCEQCQACISVRIPVKEFKASRSQKRCLKNASQFQFQTRPAYFSQQQYQLFDKYISSRHRDGDMYPTSVRQFRDFLLCDWLECNYLNIYTLADQRLIATCVFDVVNNGLSAVYTYFDPEFTQYSLGKMAILKLIEKAKELSLDYLYLGYWIKQSPKMAYKGEFRPIECFVSDKWIRMT